MKNLRIKIIILLSGTFWLGACVSSKKYQSAMSQAQETELAGRGKDMQLDKARSEMVYLQNQIQQLRTENARLEYKMRQQQDSLNEIVGKWQTEYTRLVSEYDQLAKNSSQEANLHRQNLEAKNQEVRYLAQQVKPNGQINPSISNSNGIYTSPQTNPNPDLQNAPNSQVLNNQILKSPNTEAAPQNPISETARLSAQKLSEQLKNLLENFKENELQIKTLENQTLLALGDEAWFDKSLNLNDIGKKALEVLADVLVNHKNVSVMIASETPDSEHQDASATKAQKISDFLAKNGVSSALLPKNYSPLAFDTSGTEEKKTQTFIVLKNQ
ncbi:MAG: hypothetical protein MUE85_00195 [Microscillaceae bacterium]|jgi:predicted transcriptional regulator|nr:hypothetical protein [Microscillaceae bacterium]